MNAPRFIHPTDQTLSSYGLGKLDDGSAEAVNEHLEQCPDCRKRVAEMSADSFLERVRDAQARPDSLVPLMSSTAGLSLLAGGSASSGPPSTSSLPPGLADHLDYEILRELGQGGMGVVYLAQNTLMGRMEVLKVVSGHLINRRGVLDRFLGEIRHAAQLHHPNIVTAYAALRMGESLVLAMEYVEGLDLAKLVKARGPLPVANASNYVHQAALGLQHAHEHGMVHRDIKPGNLMLARQGNRAIVKVLDFGLAKVSREVPADGALTHEGQMLGTPDFIAPEQISDARNADIRADIYSLGCTLYYLLTGGPPFPGTSLYDILQAHHSRDALPLNLARPEVPVELAALVAKMMAKEPDRRFQTPKEVAQALVPFFKPGANPGARSSPEISRVGQAAPAPQPVGGVSPLARPATPGKIPSRAPGGTSKPKPEGVAWESLIEFRETEDSEKPVAVVPKPKRRWPRWFWPAIAGAFSFALITLGVTIYVITDYGRIKIIVDGPEPVVKIDDGKILIKTPRESISLRAGEHEFTVNWRDGQFTTDKFVVSRGPNEDLHIEYEPRVNNRAGTNRQTSPSSGTASRDTAKSPAPESPVKSLLEKSIQVRTSNANTVGNIESNNFATQIDPNLTYTLTEGKIYINEVFGRKKVLCTHPVSEDSPATVNFGSITKGGTGQLVLRFHGYPVDPPGERIIVKSDGNVIHNIQIDYRDGWWKVEVPFQRNEVVVEHHAIGWMMEFLFTDYEIVGYSTAMVNGKAPTIVESKSATAQPQAVREIPPAIGPHVNFRPDALAQARSFRGDDKIVMTRYYYWYDVASKSHIVNADGSDALTTHPATLEDFSYKSVAWHKKQLSDMIAAGIDVVLPLYWGAPSERSTKAPNHWSLAGLPPLVKAAEELIHEGKNPPAIGLSYDTTTLQHNSWGVHVDLTTEYGMQWFYASIRDFFSLIPPRLWALVDGRPIIVLYLANFARAHDHRCIDFAKSEFPRQFGGRVPYIICEVSWRAKSDNVPYYMTVSREGRKFYGTAWLEALKRAPQIVLLGSWNDFLGGYSIAESRERGRQYIDLTRKFVEQFRRGVVPSASEEP